MIVEVLEEHPEEEHQEEQRLSIRSQLEEEGLEIMGDTRKQEDEYSGLTETGKIRN